METNKIRLSITWLRDHELGVVGSLAALSVLNSLFLPFTIIVSMAFWPIRRLGTGKWSVRSPAGWLIAFLAGLAILNLWTTPLPNVTLVQVERLLVGLFLFYAVVNWTNTIERLRAAAFALVSAGFMIALSAPLIVDWSLTAQYAAKIAWLPGGAYTWLSSLAMPVWLDRANPNVVAGSLVLILPVAIGWLLFTPRKAAGWQTWIIGAAALFMGIALLLSQSRGAWLAFLASMLVLVILIWPKGGLIAAGVFTAGIAAGAAAGFLPRPEAFLTSTSLESFDQRLEVWSRAAAVIKDFPFTGVGMGVFASAVDRFYPFYTFLPGSVEHAHNLFLQIAVDLGLPGLLTWLAVFTMIAKASFTSLRNMRVKPEYPRWMAGLAAGLLAGQTALAVHGLVDSVTWGLVRPAPLVWYGWGLAAALAALVNRPVQEPG